MTSKTTTFFAKADNAEGFVARATDSMAYTHVVLTGGKGDQGDYSWHTSRALATKKADTLRGQGYSPQVVAVEGRTGTKPTVVKALRAELAAPAAAPKVVVDAVTAALSPKAAKTSTKKVAAKPAKKAAAKKAEPKTPAAPKGLELAQANLAKAEKTGQPVHPGLKWRVQMFEKGMTQAKTAEAMGIREQALNRTFNGVGVPTAKMAVAFANAIGERPATVWTEVSSYELALALA